MFKLHISSIHSIRFSRFGSKRYFTDQIGVTETLPVAKPLGFWKESINRQQFIQRVVKEFDIKNQDDWYNISLKVSGNTLEIHHTYIYRTLKSVEVVDCCIITTIHQLNL